MNRELSILFILTAHDSIFKNGGGEIRTIYIIKQAQISGCKSVLVFRPSMFLDHGRVDNHFRLVKFVMPLVYFIAGAKALMIHRQRIDMIYCGTCYPRDTLGAVLLNLAFGIPVACVSHDTPAQLQGYQFYRNSEKLGIMESLGNWFLGKAEEFLIRFINLPISISAFGKTYLDSIVRGKQILESSNGILELCSDDEMVLDERVFDVTYVGRIIARKNIQMLLAATHELISNGYDLNVLLITNTIDDGLQDVCNFIESHDMVSHFTVIKNASEDEKFKLLKKSKISVNVSYDETFSISTLESASCGDALILSNISTFVGIYGENATYVGINDVVGLSSAIKGLLSDREKLMKSMRNARQVASAYIYSKVWNKEIDYFRSLFIGEP